MNKDKFQSRVEAKPFLLKEKAKLFEKEFTELLNKYNLEWNVNMVFPQYNILPPEVELAMRIILKNEVKYQLLYSEKTKKE